MTTSVLNPNEASGGPAKAGFARPGMTRPLAALLLAATVAALAVAAERWVDAWSDGHLLTVWLVVWAVVSVAILLIAGTARRIALRTLAALSQWGLERRQTRDRAQMLEKVGGDQRLLADISLVPDKARGVDGSAAGDHRSDAACSDEFDARISASAMRLRRALALM